MGDGEGYFAAYQDPYFPSGPTLPEICTCSQIDPSPQLGPAVNGSQCPTPAFCGPEPWGPLGQEAPYCHLSPSEGSCGAGKEWPLLGGIFCSTRAAKKLGPYGPAQGNFLALSPQVAGDR